MFVYEKTYLFISNDPLCKLYENIMRFILSYKKLNFYHQLEEYSSLNDKEKMQIFIMNNNEKVLHYHIILYNTIRFSQVNVY